jgi:hypothetical protein
MAGRTAAQKAASKRNLEAARKKRAASNKAKVGKGKIGPLRAIDKAKGLKSTDELSAKRRRGYRRANQFDKNGGYVNKAKAAAKSKARVKAKAKARRKASK